MLLLVVIPEMANLDELSNKKIIKKFAADSSTSYELELFNRLINNEFSDKDILKICMILYEKRNIDDSAEW